MIPRISVVQSRYGKFPVTRLTRLHSKQLGHLRLLSYLSFSVRVGLTAARETFVIRPLKSPMCPCPDASNVPNKRTSLLFSCCLLFTSSGVRSIQIAFFVTPLRKSSRERYNASPSISSLRKPATATCFPSNFSGFAISCTKLICGGSFGDCAATAGTASKNRTRTIFFMDPKGYTTRA